MNRCPKMGSAQWLLNVALWVLHADAAAGMLAISRWLLVSIACVSHAVTCRRELCVGEMARGAAQRSPRTRSVGLLALFSFAATFLLHSVSFKALAPEHAAGSLFGIADAFVGESR
jgi:hypothetical protein